MTAPDSPIVPAPSEAPGPLATATALAANPNDFGPLLRIAVEKDLDVEKLARLVELQERAMARDAAAQFAAAMAALRAEMPPIVKSVPGQHGATRKGTRTTGLYAPLDTITPILDPLVARHGMTYRFDREVRDGRDFIVCIVTHRSGHSESSRFPAPSDSTGKGRSEIQAIASGETYAKRYALLAVFGITTADPDDDGEAAGAAPVDLIDAETAANIDAMLDEAPDPKGERGRLLSWLGVASVSAIPAARAAAVVRAVEAKRAKGWKS